jgi:hypothetical protein
VIKLSPHRIVLSVGSNALMLDDPLGRAVAAHGEEFGKKISREGHENVSNWRVDSRHADCGGVSLLRERIVLRFAQVQTEEGYTLEDWRDELHELCFCLAGPEIIPLLLKKNPKAIKGIDHVLFGGTAFRVMRSKKSDPIWYFQRECLALRAVGSLYGVESVPVASTQGLPIPHPNLYWLAVYHP